MALVEPAGGGVDAAGEAALPEGLAQRNNAGAGDNNVAQGGEVVAGGNGGPAAAGAAAQNPPAAQRGGAAGNPENSMAEMFTMFPHESAIVMRRGIELGVVCSVVSRYLLRL